MLSHFAISLLDAHHLAQNITPILGTAGRQRMGLARWFTSMQRHDFTSFATLPVRFPTADKVGDFILVDFARNKYWLIIVVHFNRRKVYILHVLTRPEEDWGAWKTWQVFPRAAAALDSRKSYRSLLGDVQKARG